MKKNSVQYLIGSDNFDFKPLPPFSKVTCEFLDKLSKRLRKNEEAKKYPDLMSLAFWCRKSNILKLKKEYDDGSYRIGRGTVFHITPSNVPVNFAFSYLFGIISGNGNIVRIPSKPFPQIRIICDVISEILRDDKFDFIKRNTVFISYERDSDINNFYSSICDARIIWGGDETIRQLRKSPIKERAIEITFADRFSIGVFGSESIVEASEKELLELANKFYNDTYLMDQNACSTPHLILWMGNKVDEAQIRFWNKVALVSEKYDLAPIKVIDKYTKLCCDAIEKRNVKNVLKWTNILYVINISELPEDISVLKGIYGYFYQLPIGNLKAISSNISSKVQTLVYYGIDKEDIMKFIFENNLKGIDRIVPVGESLNIGLHWDGYDIIRSLSRHITFY